MWIIIICLANILGSSLASESSSYQPVPDYQPQHPTYGLPGSDPRCRQDGDIVIDPENRCHVFRCVMKEKKHGYDDKNVYKYFDVEKFNCPYKTINVQIQDDTYQPQIQPSYPPQQQVYAPPQQQSYPPQKQSYPPHQQLTYPLPSQRQPQYPVYHEIEVHTGVDRYTHANYLRTRIRGVAEALCNVNIHKPSEECTDVDHH